MRTENPRLSALALGVSLTWTFALCTIAGAQDLNGNFQADSLELRNGAADCNRNGFLDVVDVARPHFAQSIEHLNGVQQFQNNVWGVGSLDFNRDGRMDLALCAFTSTNFGHIALWRNEGGPGLVFHGEIPFPDARPTVIQAADVNGDGRADLISGDSSYNRVYVMLATGDGTFASAVTLNADPSNNGTTGVAVADLDNDGDLDIVATSWGTNNASLFRNNGNGTFAVRATFAAGANPRDVAVGDFTGDGLPDLAIGCENYVGTGGGSVALLRNTGNAAFTSAGTITPPTGNAPYNYTAKPFYVELSDVDHDGDRDLIVSSNFSNVLSIHRNNGSGVFTLAQRFGGAVIEGNGRDVKVADLDGDGWEEIVWCDPDLNRAMILKNNAGTYTQHNSFATSRYGGLYLAIADYSGDGRPDLLTANDTARTFSILVNKGSLNFEAPVYMRPVDFGGNALLADFTGDGKTDYGTIWSEYLATNYQFSVFPGVGVGPEARFSTAPITTPLTTTSSFTLARDINADGIMDLLTLTGRCDVRLGVGDGRFGPPISSPILPFGLRTAVADFNVDGFLDLAWIWPGHPGTMRVSFGDGGGRFGPYTEYPALAEDEAVGFGDITGDGAPEFFAGFRQQLAPPLGGVLSIFPNNGDGTFAARQDRFITATPLSPAVGAIACADFDNDGDGDVVVSANGLKLYRNPGDGVLPSTPQSVSTAAASMLEPADIDLDGDVDLYARGLTGMAVLNRGDGTFLPTMFLHSYDSNARYMVVADANNDGRADVMIGPENAWGQFLFLNFDQSSRDTNANNRPDECENLCIADVDDGSGTGTRDGGVTIDDLLYYVAIYAAGDVGADVDDGTSTGSPDGGVTIDDLLYYLGRYSAGC